MVDMIIRSNETWIASIHMKNMLEDRASGKAAACIAVA